MTAAPVLGLDAGSTTVKLCVRAAGEVPFRAYRRHRGRVHDEALALVDEARRAFPGAALVVTGSAGPALAARLGAPYVHEVHAVATAARAAVPGVRTVIELGGQDAKLIHLGEGAAPAADLNERCAAGTGTVIDRCAFRLGLDEAALAALPDGERAPPTVSARCGVFAEADVVGLVKRGHAASDALLALFDGIVRQNLVSLARGRPLPGPVCLLGGPNAFIPALARAWRRHLEARWRELGLPLLAVQTPPDAALFAALGACLSRPSLEAVERARGRRATLRPAPQPSQAAAAEEWLKAAADPVPAGRARPPRAEETVTLGLDAGSTSVKAVALGEAGDVVATAYREATGDVFSDAAAVLDEVAARAAPARLRALGITGYAAALLAPVLKADAVELETLAHARAARAFVPDADVVCDVGGQDIKVLLLDAHGVKGFHLSQQCSAGTGALLASTAAALGVPKERLGAVTATAATVPRFRIGCAVFLDTERVTAQRDGVPPADILAGLAAVLPRNVWENVVGTTALDRLGRVFVLSGGVQRSSAAVASQVAYLRERHPKARVVVHPWPGEAGAIGAALAAAEAPRPGVSRAATPAVFDVVAKSDESTACSLCPSGCARTFVTATRGDEVRTLVTGNACERGGTVDPRGAPRRRRGVDLVRFEATRLFARHRAVRQVSGAAAALTIGMPRVLAQYRAAPLFTHYLEALGLSRQRLVIGELTSEALWRSAAGRGTADACFPAKVAQAHVEKLLESRLDAVFFPAVTRAATAVRGCADTASCPVVAGAPLVTKVAFGADAAGRLPGGALLLTPALELPSRRALSPALYGAMRLLLPNLPRDEHEAALDEAIAAQAAWDGSLEALGAKVLARARRTRRCAVLLIGRPYHADPGLSHELSSELASQGRDVLTLRALPHTRERLIAAGLQRSPHDLSDLPFLTNSGDGERLAAARCAGALDTLVAVELSSFKCGQDASLYAHVAEAARGPRDKPFLALHDLDETRPVASLRLRLFTFLAAVERWERRLAKDAP